MALGALDIIIAADTAQLRKGMDEAVGIMKSSTKTMETVAKTAAGAIAGYFAFDSIRDNIKHTLDQADAISKMSQKIGVSVDSLYAMQAAGQLADVELQSIEKSLLKFNKGIGDAERGTGNTSNALKNLNISLKDSSGHLKTSDQYLFEVADKFKAMPDGIAKSTLAMDLFGKTGADMIPLLNSGSEALKEYSGIINTETAQAAERFNDSMTKIGLSAETSSTRILTGMLPTIESLSGKFEDMADWVLKNQSTIDEFTAQAGNDLTALGMVGADAFSLISDTSGDMLKVVTSVFNEIPGLMGRSSDEAIDNFGFFEYFILGMSTATNGIGQFVANAKMAYATLAEVHAKYGSVTGIITNGGYDAAKARMDYHAASLEAQKYTKNVSETYNTLISMKKEFKKKSDGNDPYVPPVDLEDFAKKESERLAAQKKADADTAKAAKEKADMIQALNDEGFQFAQENIAKQEALEKKATEDTLKRWEDSKSALLEYYSAMGDTASAFEITESDRMQKLAESGILSNEQMLAIWEKDNEAHRKSEWEKNNAFWVDLFDNVDKAMESQFFDAMTGKFTSFGNWLKDFWSSITQSMARGLSKSLADSILGTGGNQGGLVNMFRSYGGMGSVFGSAATPASLIGATTNSSGFMTTSGGTVLDAMGQITKSGSDAASVLNDLSSARSLYSIATDGLTSAIYAPSAFMGNLAGTAYGAGWTGTGSFLAGSSNVLAGGGVNGLSGAAYGGGIATAGIAGGIGGYALGSLGDALFGKSTKAGEYGAIGGTIGAIAGSIIPGLGTLVGGAIGAALGSVIGGIFGGSSHYAGSGVNIQNGATANNVVGNDYTITHVDGGWFSGSRDDYSYKPFSDAQKEAIKGTIKSYEYLLTQIGIVKELSVKGGNFATFQNFLDTSVTKSFIEAIDSLNTDAIYKTWVDYAKSVDKSLNEAIAASIGGYVNTTRSFTEWNLGKGTADQLKFTADYLTKDFNLLADSLGASGITAENYLQKYDEAIKKSFTQETITSWKNLGDALMSATDANNAYVDSLKATTTTPYDMMLSKVGVSSTPIDLKLLVDKQGEQNAQTSQMVAQLYEVIKVLKAQFTLSQMGNNQGIPA
ncbi:hypothetical protein [Sulfuricurvum sp.]|uniref:hypothetical protein n=1 Tax=Sulfuricurvum sp. TaxID=2025608 RepID=UPI003BAEBF80